MTTLSMELCVKKNVRKIMYRTALVTDVYGVHHVLKAFGTMSVVGVQNLTRTDVVADPFMAVPTKKSGAYFGTLNAIRTFMPLDAVYVVQIVQVWGSLMLVCRAKETATTMEQAIH